MIHILNDIAKSNHIPYISLKDGIIHYKNIRVTGPSLTRVWYKDGSYAEFDIEGEIKGEGSFSYGQPTTQIVNIGDAERIELGNKIISIGYCAFTECSSLTSVTYKGAEYTSDSELIAALKNGGVTVGIYAFRGFFKK